MTDVIGLVIPFFGLIFVGFVVARITRQPIEALGWMTTFVIYVALPALYFQLLSKTPFDQLGQWSFILGSVFSTFVIFSVMFVASVLMSRGEIAASTVKALAAAYGNIGYMGPGLALLAFGEEATVPVALIFCFENIMHFAIVPMLMALSGESKEPPLRLALSAIGKIVTHPFIIAIAAGVVAAYFAYQPPEPVERFLDFLQRAAAPCALFAMGVTLALRPLKRVPVEIAPIALLKLAVHPALCYVVLERRRQFFRSLDVFRRAARRLADRHQRFRDRAAIRRLGAARIGEHPDHHRAVGRERDGAALHHQDGHATA